MKTLFAAFVFSLSICSSAFAQVVDRPFNFRVTSEEPGRVTFSEFSQDFSIITEAYPEKIRFYWVSWSSFPDENSEYIELPLSVDGAGNVSIPEFRLGNFTSGTNYSFAYGLVTASGHVLWFMTQDEMEPERHSVEVQ